MATTPLNPSNPLFPDLTDEQLDRLHAYGEEDSVESGDFIFVEGQTDEDFVVILDGEVEVLVRPAGESESRSIATHGRGRFLGELGLLTGQRTMLAGRAVSNATILRIAPPQLRRLMAEETEVADLIFDAFAARRQNLQAGLATSTLRLVGSRFSARSLELGTYLRRQRVPFEWFDLEEPNSGALELIERIGVDVCDLPAVITTRATLIDPTVSELAEHLGIAYTRHPGLVHDVVVIGGGPGGLAAAVYGASEGLETVLLDAVGVGGQAGTSSRIENYLGFPSGVSGGELVERAAIQAQRLGARINSPCRVTALRDDGDTFVLELDEVSSLVTRTVVLAMGVKYRKLPLDELARFEGAGVYYAATELEAAVCSGSPVTVVGGGNSAGQAAVFLAQRGSQVRVAIRGDDLTKSMSTYLIDRIEASPDIEVATRVNVVGLHGDRRLEEVDLDIAGEITRVPCNGLFSFIGAEPASEWLPEEIATDEKGFILTDRSLPGEAGLDALPFETSMPGVFAAGDIRVGSMKRVAAAVGEGSSVIRSVHDHLSRFSAPTPTA